MQNNRGHIILVMLILLSILSVGVIQITQMIGTAHQTQRLAYLYVKSNYLAKSGLRVAPKVWAQIPTQPISSTTPKDWMYTHLSNCYHPSLPLEGDCYLAKDSQNRLYSAGVYSTSRRLMRTKAVVVSGNVTVLDWEEL